MDMIFGILSLGFLILILGTRLGKVFERHLWETRLNSGEIATRKSRVYTVTEINL